MSSYASPARLASYESKRKGRVCDLQDCADPHYAKGLCETHWATAARYGLSVEQLAALPKSCEVCGSAEGQVNIDHDHTSGTVRGVLCTACNIALGLLHDDPIRIAALLAYLHVKGFA